MLSRSASMNGPGFGVVAAAVSRRRTGDGLAVIDLACIAQISAQAGVDDVPA